MQKVEIRALAKLAALNELLNYESESQEYARGFLAGFFDAEGNNSGNLRMAQKDNTVLERVINYGSKLGFLFKLEKFAARHADTVRLEGPQRERIRFFATCQPAITRKHLDIWDRTLYAEPDPVVKIEKAADQDVVDIQTSTHTFFAGGLATHNCYAEALNRNCFFGGNGLPYRGAPPTLRLRQEIIDSWARQRTPKKHFVASMTDVCGDWVPGWMIFQYLDGMAAAPRQTFQWLTKRADVMLREVRAWLDARGLASLPPNIWPGVTVENQEWANKRRAFFEAIPAQTKFVSYEPALGPVNWAGWEFVSQIIAGGESGPQARPAHPAWFHQTRDWCARNKKAFFFKQHGEFAHWQDIARYENGKWIEPDWFSDDIPGVWIEPDGRTSQRTDNDAAEFVYRVGKARAGRILDGVEWSQAPAAGR